jgi:hypothetical protein
MSIARVSVPKMLAPNFKDGIIYSLLPLSVKTLSCQTIRLAVSGK